MTIYNPYLQSAGHLPYTDSNSLTTTPIATTTAAKAVVTVIAKNGEVIGIARRVIFKNKQKFIAGSRMMAESSRILAEWIAGPQIYTNDIHAALAAAGEDGPQPTL
jgi:hypothetical protein